MNVSKVQAIIFIFKTLFEQGYIKKNDIQQTIDISNVTFRRYIQELRAYLVNFNEPYELKYDKSEDKYLLIKI